jgi:hypothetical protein
VALRWLLLACLPLTACASALTDEMAETMEATREANVRAMNGLADSAERMPVTLDRVNALLLRAEAASDEALAAQATLTTEVAAVASSTALAIANMAALARSLDEAARAAGMLLQDARADVAATSAERTQILATVAAVGSTTQSLLGHADRAAAAWEERAPQVREDEARAVRALADLTESSARTGAQVATLAEAATRVATKLEPELTSSAGSVARVMGDVEKITARLASEEMAAATVGSTVLAALVGSAGTVALVFILRAQFRKAVERELETRLRG